MMLSWHTLTHIFIVNKITCYYTSQDFKLKFALNTAGASFYYLCTTLSKPSSSLTCSHPCHKGGSTRTDVVNVREDLQLLCRLVTDAVCLQEIHTKGELTQGFP